MKRSAFAEDKWLLNRIIEDMKERFDKLGDDDRQKFLESAISLTEFGMVSSPSYSEYNPIAARLIRDTLGITRESLSLIVKMHPLTLYKMEADKLSFNPDKPKHRAYLNWLISNGYQIPLRKV